MARPRTPTAKAAVTGAVLKDPQRFKGRSDPKTHPLGEPSEFLTETERQAWEGFRHEFPWLMECHRTLVEIACRLRARLWTDPDMGVQALGQLRMCVSAMGGTPADMSKVMIPDGEEEDPDDQFYN